MQAIRVNEKSETSDDLKCELAEIETRSPGRGNVYEVASGVNPSDVKALLGKMPDLAGRARRPRFRGHSSRRSGPLYRQRGLGHRRRSRNET